MGHEYLRAQKLSSFQNGIELSGVPAPVPGLINKAPGVTGREGEGKTETCCVEVQPAECVGFTKDAGDFVAAGCIDIDRAAGVMFAATRWRQCGENGFRSNTRLLFQANESCLVIEAAPG